MMDDLIRRKVARYDGCYLVTTIEEFAALEKANADLSAKLGAAQDRIRELETGGAVVHAAWIRDEDGICTCTACGEKDVWDYKYCPNCGARMDGDHIREATKMVDGGDGNAD